jgi:hypothetical protein
VPVLAPGDYAVPFQFTLPTGVASSLYYKNKHHHAKPKAKVKYHIRATLKGHHDKNLMKYKQILTIREPGEYAQAHIHRKDEHRITTWCCVDQGISAIEVHFEKNVFEPHEICRAHVKLDNSRCNVALTGVRLAIEQEVYIRADGHTFNQTFTLADKHEAGVDARHEAGVERSLELPLASIKYEIAKERKKKGQVKALSPEDLWMASQMQPACHGHHVRNEYFLAIRCSY